MPYVKIADYREHTSEMVGDGCSVDCRSGIENEVGCGKGQLSRLHPAVWAVLLVSQ